MRLFVERAQAHKPAFELNEREAPAVAELVARLEGIPLALELAAARVRSLSVADINTRLKDRYKILTGGSRVLQERQQTLRALVDWSYELLNENEQLMLRRLAVFIGGFDLEAAEKVCGVEPIEDFEVLDLLGSLVEKSLVMLEERDDGSRYRMLETIRDYAREKLQQDADEAAAAAVRHCDYFFQLAKDANRGLDGAEQGTWMRRVEAELDNIRGAVTLSMIGGVDPVIAVKFCVAMLGFWILRGYASEGREVVKAALELPAIGASDLAQAHALVRRRGAGRGAKRPCRGAQDAGVLPGTAPRTGQPGRRRCDAVDAVDGAPARWRCRGGQRGRAGGAGDLPPSGRPRRRGASGCFTWARLRSTWVRMSRPVATCSSRLTWHAISNIASWKASAS